MRSLAKVSCERCQFLSAKTTGVATFIVSHAPSAETLKQLNTVRRNNSSFKLRDRRDAVDSPTLAICNLVDKV